MDQIIPHLFISNWQVSNNIDEIKRNNIQAVITIETQPKSVKIIEYYQKNNIDFLYLKLPDALEANISQYFDISFDFIDAHVRRKQNVLIHCWAGVSRSATLILNYILKKTIIKNGKNNPCIKCLTTNILQYMRSKRSIINPNPGFMNQIMNYY
jgi:dual specificity phosphatase 12